MVDIELLYRDPSGTVDIDRGTLLTDEQLLDLYAPIDRGRPSVRMNFVASLDGSATVDGLSGGLGGPSDLRVFDLLRRLCDTVLVGAGTVRAEGYGAMRVSPEAATWREAHGYAAQPVFGIVSAHLNLDPATDVFAKAPVRPVVFTVEAADPEARAALAEVADVIDCGATTVDPARILAWYGERGMTRVHGEGGPSLFGSFLAADSVDELCLTIDSILEGGVGPRISHSGLVGAPHELTLSTLLLSGSTLLSRYSR